MACKTSFELHHNFPRIAEESGFAFNLHRPRVQIDWNKIKLIDIESLVRNRTFTLVEQHIPDILDCVIDLEFDVRILDEGFLKLFRLAQLSVEYQQFCRHYLDRSVMLLREEITNLRQELNSTKNILKDKDEEIKRIKRKMKQTIRTPLPYGNDNIASMILKTLNQSKTDIFASTSQVDTMYYNKCNYCDKVFLNQLYLKSHISRRHESTTDIPQKDTEDKPNVTPEFNNEISELKTKLKQLEDLLLTTSSNKNPPVAEKETENNNINAITPMKQMKDAEVSVTNDEELFEKIQKWKVQEQDNYSKEINLLRTQILDLINNKQTQNNVLIDIELTKIEELQKTIKEQGSEILSLKDKLQKRSDDEANKKVEIESQISYWVKQAETQSSQFASLLQKLNVVENEAKEYRVKADAEAQRSTQLQQLLHDQMMKQSNINTNVKQKETPIHNEQQNQLKENATNFLNKDDKPAVYDNTFRKLQQKAQELLNIQNMNSTDTSSASDLNDNKYQIQNLENNQNLQISSDVKTDKSEVVKNNIVRTQKYGVTVDKDYVDKKKGIEKKLKHKSKSVKQKPQFTTESPIRVIRAKVNEEVNSRLAELGVDPLKNRLAKKDFLKQRMLLQEQHGAKTKQFPKRDNVLHRILTHIDASAITLNKKTTDTKKDMNHISPKKSPRSFSLSSVLSNVKTKTLSLVKSNETRNNSANPYENVAKKAIALLKTPPGSAHSSPTIKDRQMSQQNLFTLNTEKEYEQSNQYIPTHDIKIKSPKAKVCSNIETEVSNEENSLSLEPTANVKLISSPNNVHQNIEKNNPSIDELKNTITENNENSSDGIESLIDSPPRRAMSEETLNNIKQTKSVLKNASSTSSISKKKVLFDMNAIQIKSVSASPSQSTTEKSEVNEQYELGIQNLDTDEWDLSSIENLSLPDPTKEPNKVKIVSHQSPKIAELKQTIESQLARRDPTLTTALIGGVDMLAGPLRKGTSLGGSNTSLGSSILDESEVVPVRPSNYLSNISLPKHVN